MEGSVRWSLETLGGEVLTSGEAYVHVGPQAAAQVCTLDFSDRITDDNRRNLVFVAELWQRAERLALQVASFVPTKHLALTAPDIDLHSRKENGQLIVELTSHSLARLVEVGLEGIDTIWSDNYFDLPASRPVTLSCPLPAGWTLERGREALKLRSVYDSYAHSAAR
jgi:beta-mannosidase